MKNIKMLTIALLLGASSCVHAVRVTNASTSNIKVFLTGKNSADDRRYAWRADRMGGSSTFKGSANNHESEALRSNSIGQGGVDAIIKPGETVTINNSHTKSSYIPVFFLNDKDSSNVLKRIGVTWDDFSDNVHLIIVGNDLNGGLGTIQSAVGGFRNRQLLATPGLGGGLTDLSKLDDYVNLIPVKINDSSSSNALSMFY